jgi:hypothetical protein
MDAPKGETPCHATFSTFGVTAHTRTATARSFPTSRLHAAAIDTTHDFLVERGKLAGGQSFEITDSGAVLATVEIHRATADEAAAAS